MITQQTDQVAQAKALLLTQFSDATVLQAFLAGYAKQIQILEDVAFDMLTKRSLATAEGTQLDEIGVLVNLLRQGQDDTTYRANLATQIKILHTSCVTDEINIIIRGLIADSYFWFMRQGNASVDIEFSVNIGDTPTPLAVAKRLREFIAAGVRCVICWDDSFGTGGRAAPLSFGPGDDIDGLSAGLSDAGGTIDGYFAHGSDGEVPESIF